MWNGSVVVYVLHFTYSTISRTELSEILHHLTKFSGPHLQGDHLCNSCWIACSAGKDSIGCHSFPMAARHVSISAMKLGHQASALRHISVRKDLPQDTWLYIGRPIRALPFNVDLISKISNLRKWNLVKRLSSELWARWVPDLDHPI